MKRAFDIAVSLFLLLVIWPLLLVIAAAIAVTGGAPVFFRQVRVGRHGKHFRIWKFRTMIRDAEQAGRQLTVGRDARITRVGAVLRATKFDELPQLLNVLAGEMSLVGPRPEVPRYVAEYTDRQRDVLKLTPGVTDPASIRYFRESDLLAEADDPEAVYIDEIMPEKIRLNLEYAERSSVTADVGVLVRTAIRLVA
ncbi:MAG: sugar transferase [Pirellulaceae bacterium]|nr:sugar transferase [Pirellulaceae bacterium]MDP7019381.1 sugar transferase [Pirellulaceae bacterium]